MPLLAFDTWVELRRSLGWAEAWAVVDTPERAHRGGSWLFSRAHGALEVRVFGPRARGDAKEDSDLDLLVNLAGGRSSRGRGPRLSMARLTALGRTSIVSVGAGSSGKYTDLRVLDQPLGLPEGHELELHVNDDGLGVEERAALHEAIGKRKRRPSPEKARSKRLERP